MVLSQNLDFIGLLVSVLICSILLFAFFRVMIFSYSSSRQFGSQGRIITGDYLLVDKSSIDWDVLSPAENKTEVIVITNQAPVSQVFSLSTSDWEPANASDFISLTWNYTGFAVSSKQSIPVALTIHVDPYIQGIETFSFNIIITGVQA